MTATTAEKPPMEIHELERSSCRWPIGDPGGEILMRYCGARVPETTLAAGLSYCAHHSSLAYAATGRRGTRVAAK